MTVDDPTPEPPELPHALALAWGVAASPNRGPRRELSIERIVDTAIELADADGLDGVSMAKVAQRLGYTTMSLYRYVTSKDDLLLLMQEQVIGVEPPPAHEPSDWRAELREWSQFTQSLLGAHPWYLDIPVQGAPVTPNNLQIVDRGLRALRDVPLDQEEKMAVILLASNYGKAAAQLERDLARAVAAAGGHDEVLGGAYESVLRDLVDAERFPYLRPLVESGSYVGEGQIDDVAFGLERVLDGIAAYIDARASGLPGAGRDFASRDAAGPAETGRADSGPTAQHGGSLTGDDDDLRASAALASRFARDPRVKKAAEKRKDAERRVRELRKAAQEAEKKVREGEKAVREALRAEADAARSAAERDAP
ncbi:TetR/AcrR family transcriptional regulator [Luteimicrobium subarcticum]|uniref:TetR family transcriptional regulator n=1 Tax=Luteimicrobium subarcticum TaxID=620910 RepID=A0A2M8WRV9_9MICO|nr:TetR/AcrR family transcriptional regulator [Luteimicrobium subarcticum]PJI93614.1 TetR family transcriptional regulator [Luteimicrobium subarcticum]